MSIKSRVAIEYGDFAPNAKENFVPNANNNASFSKIEQLQELTIDVKNFGNPCEEYSVILDGSALTFPDDIEDEDMGYQSNSISDENGFFETPIILTLTANGNYTSSGFTFTFDTDNNIFPNDMMIQWYQNDSLLDSMAFQPTNAFYFCNNAVEHFNRVVITFNNLNLPYNRLKIRSIDYGYGTVFYGDELRSINVIQEIDPISREIIINPVDFVLASKRNIEYNFQAKQPLLVKFNNELVQTNFIDSAQRTGKKMWNIHTNDYIGYLDKVTFLGGMYFSHNAVELLNSISEQTKIPFNIAESLNDLTLTGHIPICSCRQALQKIAFALGAVVDTSASNAVEIYELSNDIKHNISLDRIRQGQNFSSTDKITEVQLSYHQYIENSEKTELYNAFESGAGSDILVTFNEPHHDLDIIYGSITKSGANFAIINASNVNCKLTGKGYKDVVVVKSIKNPDVLANDIENIQSITDETLISSDNVDKILNKCYNYFSKNNIVNMGIVQKKTDDEINVGDVITASTEYLGTVTGRIISARYNLNGGILVKECEMQ